MTLTLQEEEFKERRCRLICLDLDGTLLNDEKEIDPEDIREIREASEKGIEIALVTGRMPAATEPIAKKLGVPCILACDAGTYIEKENQCISSEYLPIAAMRMVYMAADNFRIPLWIFRHKQWFVTGMDPVIKKEIETIHYIPRQVSMEELVHEWEKEGICPNKLLIGAEPETVQKVYSRLKELRIEGIDMACSSDHFLEIFPKGMNKGRALELICRAQNIDPEDTYAFGDQELDIPMLEAAGTAIAMGNGIPEIKRAADFVTRTNNEAGIAHALRYFEAWNLRAQK